MIEGVSSLLNIAMPVATDEVTEKLSKMKVVKRDGRLVDFDDEKIYDALMKGRKKLKEPLSPLEREKLVEIVQLVDREIAERFTDNVKIYEIQNIVEHFLLEKSFLAFSARIY